MYLLEIVFTFVFINYIMENELVKLLQKFLNAPFYYHELLAFLDKQEDLLLKPEVANKINEDEYNALWDTYLEMEEIFKYANAPNLVVGTWTNVKDVYGRNLKWRNIN